MLKTKLELPVGTRLFSLPAKKDGEPLTLDEWEVMGTLHGKTVVVCKSDERSEVHAIYTDLDGNIYNSPGGWKYWRTAQECVADGIAAEHRTVLAWRENLEDAEDTLHQLRELQERLRAS